jgi:hypothetical protein
VGAIGPEPTGTLLTYLPPTGWADVATTRAVRAVQAALRGEMAELRTEGRTGLAQIRAELHHELRIQFFWMVTLQLTVLAAIVSLLSSDLLL